MANTEVELVAELEKVKRKNPKLVQRIIDNAKRGHYHDFKSNMMMPKVTLTRDLQAAGLDELASRVINGDYDEEYPSPEEEERLRETLFKRGVAARA